MKKVVINVHNGGFGLSPMALKMLAKLQGKKCYFFVFNTKNNKYERINQKKLKNHDFFVAFNTPKPNFNEDSRELFEKQKILSYNMERDNPLLVKVVEELGYKANSCFSVLKVVEIPDDVDWIIMEYNGVEWIAEKHRIWE